MGVAISEKGGHVPGALSLPAASLFNTDSTLESPERLERLFGLYGITRESKKIVVATCNTNSLASNTYMSLRYLGYDNVRPYDGPWAEWAKMYK